MDTRSKNENIKKKNPVFSPLRKNALGPAADYRFYFLYTYEKVLRTRSDRLRVFEQLPPF